MSFLLSFYCLQECKAESLNNIFAEMTYFIGNEYTAERVKLADGEYKERYLKVYYEDMFVVGDFNKDGLEDAAVVIAESGGGSGHFRELAFLINNGKGFVHKASQYLGDRVIINSLKEENGKIIMDMFVHGEGDCLAGPTKRVVNVYEYAGPTVWGPPFSEVIVKK